MIKIKNFSRNIDFNSIDQPYCPTHLMCNQQARVILANDGLTMYSHLFELFHSQLDKGVAWPDRGFKSFNHFYNPCTGRGLPGSKPAYYSFMSYLEYSSHLWLQGNYSASMFFLGAATHFLQDLCEPHHSNCQLLHGHSSYEHWVEDNLMSFTVCSDGIYDNWSPDRWLERCAEFSKDWLPLVSGNETLFGEASMNLLAFTQRMTAGFWAYFIRLVYKNELPAVLRKVV